MQIIVGFATDSPVVTELLESACGAYGEIKIMSLTNFCRGLLRDLQTSTGNTSPEFIAKAKTALSKIYGNDAWIKYALSQINPAGNEAIIITGLTNPDEVAAINAMPRGETWFVGPTEEPTARISKQMCGSLSKMFTIFRKSHRVPLENNQLVNTLNSLITEAVERSRVRDDSPASRATAFTGVRKVNPVLGGDINIKPHY